MLVPVDALWQFSHDRHGAVGEAGGAKILLGIRTGGLGAVRVFYEKGAIEPAHQGLGLAHGLVSILLQTRQFFWGQGDDLGNGQTRQGLNGDVVGDGHVGPPQPACRVKPGVAWRICSAS